MTILDRWEARFSRITSSGRLIPEIDGLRFVAIASVVLFHLGVEVRSSADDLASPLHALVSRGYAGVLLFFTISGFVLALPFAEARLRGGPEPGLRAYYLRRLSRIEPPYFISLLVFAALAVLFRGIRPESLAPHLGASLLYVHNAVYGAFSRVNPVAWSLEIEVQFYLAAPLMAQVFRIRGAAARRLLLAALIAAFSAFHEAYAAHAPYRLYLSLPAFLHYFLAGFLLADLYAGDWRGNPVRSAAWDVAGLLAWAAVPAALILPAPVRGLLPLAFLVAAAAALRGRLLNRLARQRILVLVGGMCYTIYLYHSGILAFSVRAVESLVDRAFPFWARYALHAPAALLLTLGVCALLFLALERPFMRRGWYRRSGPGSAQISAGVSEDRSR